MSIKNIENLISTLIKDGDKDTLDNLIELLEEIRDFKKDSKKTSKPVEKKKVEEYASGEDHASKLLDYFYETGGSKYTPKMVHYPSLSEPSVTSVSSGIPDDLVTLAPDDPDRDAYLSLLM